VNLTINLSHIVANYQLINERVAGGARTAAVVKANAYGLGCVEVAKALVAAHCREFFVANLDEAVELRSAQKDVTIYVLDGVTCTTAAAMLEHNLIPVLNSLEQISCWAKSAELHQKALAACVHLDTGMNRTGLGADETALLIAEPWRLSPLNVVLVLSHLASADLVDSNQNLEQLSLFRKYRQQLPLGAASLANSAGTFLDSAYHFDVVRPGVALYGGNPAPHKANPMRQVVSLTAPLLQVRNVDRGDRVGYGATHEFSRKGKVATVPLGYADGFFRSFSNSAFAYVGSVKVPLIGRVSMDLITLDVSDVADSALYVGAPVEVLGTQLTVDEVAHNAGTIAHELLAALGNRYKRCYVYNRSEQTQNK